MFLLLLTPFIIGFKSEPDGSADTLGVLQVLWLSGHNPVFIDGYDAISGVESPSTSKLRRAATGTTVAAGTTAFGRSYMEKAKNFFGRWVLRKGTR